MEKSLSGRFAMSRHALQITAIVAMIIDHMSVFAVNPLMFYIMKGIGRITIVIMCYFVAEGYSKTRNIGKYIIRLGIFAAVSQIPYFVYAFYGNFPSNVNALIVDVFTYRNVIFTLFAGLSLLTIVKSDYCVPVKLLAAAMALYLVRNSDWGYYGVLWIVGCGMFAKRREKLVWIAFVLALRIVAIGVTMLATIAETGLLPYSMLYNWIAQFGGFFAIPLLAAYNGERGSGSRFAMYIFYPAHLIAIVLLMTIR